MSGAKANHPAGITLLLVEDEPLILIDLEYAAEDLGCLPLRAHNCTEALALVERHGASLGAAVLDVSLGESETCLPVARKLEELGIPFLLHSGDLDRQEEQIRQLTAQLIAKPAPAETVIAAALALARGSGEGVVAAE